jgi:hypothetical protein
VLSSLNCFAQTSSAPGADNPAASPSSPSSTDKPADAAKTKPEAAAKKKARKPANKLAAPAKPTAGQTPQTQAAKQTWPTQADVQRIALERDKANLQQLRETTLKLIRSLVSRGLLPQEEAAQMVSESDREAVVVPPSAARTVAPAATAALAAPSAIASLAPTESNPALSAQPSAATQAARTQAPPGAANTPSRTSPNLADSELEEPPTEEPVVRVPYVPEVVKNQIRDQVREEVMAQAKAEHWAAPNSVPEWLDRISLEGDLMLRYEADRYGSGNTPVLAYNNITGANLTNTTQDTNRFRYRARIGLLAKITPTWSGGFGLASGDTNSPVATLQTLGNYANRGPITIDRAYLRWDPSEAFTLSGGRMANPYFNTDLMWDIDLAFEGAYASYRPRFSDKLSGFATAGAYIIQTASPTPETPDPKSKYLLGLQVGTDWGANENTKLRSALAYYGYKNVSGIPNPTLNSHIYDWTAPLFRQKGNTVFNIDNDNNPATNLYALASKFQILNLTAKLDLTRFDPFAVRLTADYAKNIGFDQSEIRQRTGLTVEPATTAWRTGVAFGKLEVTEWKDWQVFADYRYLGADAVLDAFTDSEFYLGGTNAKGYTIGGLFGLDHNVWMRVRWMSADEIRGPPLAIDILQVDLNARF